MRGSIKQRKQRASTGTVLAVYIYLQHRKLYIISVIGVIEASRNAMLF